MPAEAGEAAVAEGRAVAGEAAVAEGRALARGGAVADEPAVVEVAVSVVRERPVQGASRRGVAVAEGHRHQARRELGKQVRVSRLRREARRRNNEERAPRIRLSARKA
jgi:hypothetical protein